MRILKLYALTTLFFLLLISKANASVSPNNWSERYNFSAITMDEGLPHNFIDDIIKDSKGFLWIATNGAGIARYDGYEFIPFNMGEPHNKLKSNFIKKLCEDKFKRLWIGSESGIDIIDLQTLQITQINNGNQKFEQLCNSPIYQIYCSKSGNLWLCSKNSLYKIIFSHSGEVIQTIEVCHLSEKESINTICEIDESLWFNYRNEICRIKEMSITQQNPTTISSTLKIPWGAIIQKIYRKDNELWIGTTQGLFRYNIDTEMIKQYIHDPNNNKSLSQDYITDIIETSEYTMLVSTLKGINLYNTLTDKFERIYNEINLSHNSTGIHNRLNCNFVNCLFRDGDVIWIGTEAGGINKMTRSKIFVKNYIHSDNTSESISMNPVNAIYQDETEAIWVGTVEGGINRLAPGSNSFTHYTTAPPTHLSHNTVSCFTADKNGKLWIGTWGGGIGWIDKTNPLNKEFHHVNIPDYFDITWGFVCAICYDPINDGIWIATSNSIYIFDLKRQTVIEPFKGLNLGGMEGGNAGCFIDKENHLWLGMTAGLCRIDLQTLRTPKLIYKLWKNKLDVPQSNLKEKVSFIFQSRDSTLWIGSNGYGFYKSSFNEKKEYIFQAFTTEDGLANNCVRGITEDNNGYIWITTLKGLSRFDPVNNNFHNYTKKDGLSSNQFYWNAACCAKNGDLYLGSISGLSVIKPNINNDLHQNIPIEFTQIRISNQKIIPRDGIIQMHERDKSLYIEFAALNYDTSNLAYYSYRLKGFNDKWIKTTANQRIANYTNLHPGNYTFEVRYSLNGKDWIGHSRKLSITVAPYFYKTFRFTTLTIISFLLVIYYIFTWRTHTLKKQRKVLQIKVEERTHELEKQKELLSQHAGELNKQNEILIQQNEDIKKQKLELEQMSQRIQELTVDKLAFFTNITHEFRTPLTLITGPIERALKLSCNPKVIEQLNLVERNSKYLLSLINQLMDFRKIESGKMKLIYTPGNLLHFFEELLIPFYSYATSKGITIKTYFHLPSYELMFDEEAMHKVIVNLISNALKFTPKEGSVSIYASFLLFNGKERLFISVKDTGKGIAKEDLDKVFDRFYQANNQSHISIMGQSGTGIGLYLCKHIIELHGGNICVKNNPSSGCTFRILLPLQYSENQHKNIKVSAEPISHTKSIAKSKLTILIVEDNKDMRDYIRSILNDYYLIIEASQGEEALAILQSQNIDFIISDLMMPVMDGMELSRQVKNIFSISHIPFLMLTAKTSNETRIESYKIGVDEYLLKPFDEELLLARIANILETRQQMQKKFLLKMDIDTLDIEEESNDKIFLNKALQIIKNNYKNPDYEINDFVEAMGVSRTLAYKKIQDLTGQSAGYFIRNYRLNIARELILKNKITHNMNISEIAYEVGFNDPKYFTRCFTKRFNITPSKLLSNDS